ncbi:MAG: EamA family transporter [Novosphingobium sp.]
MLWVSATIAASIALLARNAIQAGLTREIGTLGATMVRFVYGAPFALLLHTAAMYWTGSGWPALTLAFVGPAAVGAFCQIGGTALMLKAMDLRGFAVANAYIKMEPVLLALGGWWILGDVLAPLAWLGIAVATGGVLLAAFPRGTTLAVMRGQGAAIAVGLVAAGLFGFSAICFRAGVLALGDGPAVMRALHMLLATILIQSATMLVWLGISDRAALAGSLRRWRRCTLAGLAGACASMGWFTGFALTAAANVRTLSLIELPIAALVNRPLTGRAPSRRELAGIALVMAGIGLLLRAELA